MSHELSYGNALAKRINGLYKAELIYHRAPWKTKESLELATLERVSWFNLARLFRGTPLYDRVGLNLSV
jgi:transposase InsO family protein